MKKVNWGIIGLGSIATKFADGFKNSENAKLIAISSKNSNKLKKFKEQFKINENYCFDDYKNLLKCNDVDIIYIALPNSLHHEWIIECIKNNKKVLVEKPATVNFSEIKNIKDFHYNKDVFFAEAFMYRYHPQILKVIELVNKDVIGKLISMDSVFGIDILTKKNFFGFKIKKKLNKESRLYNKNLGGGAILDLGCYPVSFSTLIASLISKIDYSKVRVLNKKKEIGSTGVDIDSYAELNFENNFKCNVSASFTRNLGKYSKIVGSKGELILENTWHASPSIIKILGENSQKIEIDDHGNIYSHEINKLSKCILENKKNPDFPGLTMNDTLENMKILDSWLN